MVFNLSIALTWILFLALFPVSFFWLRRAWRVLIKRDYSEVALKRGKSPENPKKWALPVGIVNLVAGAVTLWIVIGVPFWIATGIKIGPFSHYQSWSALAGSTIWLKIILDFTIRQQAHPFAIGRKKKKES